MSKAYLHDYIDMLVKLERCAGDKVSYRILEPFRVSYTLMGLQDVAKRIAEFIKLDQYRFLVATTRQKEAQAAHIELEHGPKEVYIEISEDFLSWDQDAILATLSHEICHKFLHHYGLRLYGPQEEYENEVFTDVTAVYLGLGKLMLNGCQYSTSSTTNDAYSTTTTTTHRFGYLSREQLAALYMLVCAMRKTPFGKAMDYLNKDAEAAVRRAQGQFSDLSEEKYHDVSFGEQISERVLEEVKQAQLSLSKTRTLLDILLSLYLVPPRRFWEKSHKDIQSLLRKSCIQEEPEYNPALRYLYSLQAEREFTEVKTKLSLTEKENRKVMKDLLSLLALTSQQRALEKRGRLRPRCPLDNTIIDTPYSEQQTMVTCPTCQYSFYLAGISKEAMTSLLLTQHLSWWRRLFLRLRGSE